jgi:hypothetical protein
MERLRDVFDLVFLPGAVYNARTRPRPKATYGAFFFRKLRNAGAFVLRHELD